MNEIMQHLLVSLLASTLLAATAVVGKALTKAALILAWSCAVVITFCGGLSSFAILAATFFFTVLAGKIGRHRRAFEKQIHAKSGKRDVVQIFCNVGLGTVLLAVGAVLRDSRFLQVYAAVMAASLADSMASELGVLSKGDPIDLCTMKKTPRGLSGGVSLLGLCSSLLGAAVIAAVYAIGKPWDISVLLQITLCGFAGALVDSIFGSLLQVKYRCSVCGILTEKTAHCNQPTERVRGCRSITNDTVNFMSNVTVGILALFLFLR